MEGQLRTESPAESPVIDETSTPYVGKWNRLVSTTNWEKGRIICEWQAALAESGADASAYTDEAWSRMVGGVSPQHTGRLRRVWHRFGETFEQYEGLYWSHFLASLDWHDAEMWLEGAVREGWSISQMRRTHWEATGAVEEEKPREEDVVAAEPAEEVDSDVDEPLPEEISESLGEVQDALPEPPEEGSDPEDVPPVDAELPLDQPEIDPVRPFENLPELPPDLNEAFESFKLAVLNHKVAGWQDVSRDAVLHVLDALKTLALAPADQ